MKLENNNDEYTTIDFESWNIFHYFIAFFPIAIVASAMILAYIML